MPTGPPTGIPEPGQLPPPRAATLWARARLLAGGAVAPPSAAPRRWAGTLPGLALCSGAGGLHALAFAPANQPWLALAALAWVAYFGLHAPSRRAAFLAGWAFGCGWLGLGLSWLYISLHQYGQMMAWLAAAATAVLAAGLALLPGLALAGAAACTPPGGRRRALALVAAWTLAEWSRGVVLTGMPWLSTGYAYVDHPLAGYAPVVGVYGVGASAILVAVLLPLAWREQRARATAGAAAALALALGVLGTGQMLRLQTWSQPDGAPIRVRLVQGNIPQDMKFGAAGLDLASARYLPALHAAAMRDAQDHEVAAGTPAPDLIVLPESAFPVPVGDLPEAVLQVLTDPRERAGAALIFGAFVVEPHWRYFNSAIGLGRAGAAPQRYSKRHLVPFGEFVPYGFHWFVDLLRIPIGDQEQGAEFQPPMALAGQRIAVNICFEDLFGALIIDAWHDPQQAPTILLNLSNLGWFDDSNALPQHLQISRMRALETARPLLRATNTGLTAIIDARGQVSAALTPLRQALLDGTVQGSSGTTPFVRYGNRPILLLAGALLLLCAALPRRAANAAAARPPPVSPQ